MSQQNDLNRTDAAQALGFNSMEGYNRASSGLSGLDAVFDGLRLGDCVVWQVDSFVQYQSLVAPFAGCAIAEGRELVYFRFGKHEPLVAADPDVTTYQLDPQLGFETFASQVHEIIEETGYGAFYVFDSLTDLLSAWRSDLAVGNFFQVTVPRLFELDSVAYFGLERNQHTFATLATIRDTTQMLIDVYQVDKSVYVHPLKVWLRHSPTMFFPHRISGDDVRPITGAAETAQLLAKAARRVDPPDHWQRAINRAEAALASGDEASQAELAAELIDMFIGREGRMAELCRRYFTLSDLVNIAKREIGTGFIGGKSVGMLAARAVLVNDAQQRFAGRLEQHDSYFLGSDLFYAFIIANGWWNLWLEQKSSEGYFSAGESLHRLLGTGRFPPAVRERFMDMLEYFENAPIIVRSSSLLEDGFGNAFAGKYESVFCANQGNLEQRLLALEAAVRQVYASAMNQDALAYRRDRGLDQVDEQMAILVQRVSGAQHGDFFFPDAAGVGNSHNVYVWDPSIDPHAGMLRLVFGLGTRAVDRTITDYAKLIALDDPMRASHDQAGRTQRYVDLIDLTENKQSTKPLVDVLRGERSADWQLFLSDDQATIRWLRENNRPMKSVPQILDFHDLLAQTDFAQLMRNIFAALEDAYQHPVDIEYTINIKNGVPMINLVQCRPLQTRGLGKQVAMPTEVPDEQTLMATKGDFMGGNVRLPLDYAILVRPEAYLHLSHQERYAVARAMGVLNRKLADYAFLIAAPGRWGTTTPALGIPVHFTEISNAAVMVEFTYSSAGFLPELSQGSHFFQDLVESGIFYAAIFDRNRTTTFHPELVTGKANLLGQFAPDLAGLSEVIHLGSMENMVLYADIETQQMICCQAH